MTAVHPGIQANIDGYARRARSYDAVHAEIFNSREQARLDSAIGRAVDAIESGGTKALDFGCGTGNLTRHMRTRSLAVTCADVSPQFLRIVAERYETSTIELVGGSTDVVPDDEFDLVGLYSVLHHVPDYLGLVGQLVSKVKRGGVLFVDHECNQNYWTPNPELTQFRQAMRAAQLERRWCPEHKRWQRFLTLSHYRASYRRLRRLNVEIEGDIHIHANDHVDLDAVVRVAIDAGCEVVERMNYLLFRGGGYSEPVWEKWADRTTDTGGAILRRL